MADSSTESRPYAIAAFKQAREEGQVDQWSQMLALLAGPIHVTLVTMVPHVWDSLFTRARRSSSH